MTEKYYVYILRCDDGAKYYGHTTNLEQRFIAHENGLVAFTKRRRPIELVYFEEFEDRSKAFKREMLFKNDKTRKKTIEKLITNFPRAKCQGFNSRSHLRSLNVLAP